MMTLLAALVLLAPRATLHQDQGSLTLPVSPTSSISFALLNLQSRGLRIDPGDVRLDKVRTKFERQVKGNSLEDLLLFALGRCDPPLAYDEIERGSVSEGAFVRLRYADPKQRDASGAFRLDANGHIRLMLEKVAVTYQGTKFDTSSLDWSLFGERKDGNRTWNVLSDKYTGNSMEQLLEEMFKDSRPTLRAVKTGDKQFRIEVPFPLVGIQLWKHNDQDPKQPNTYRKLDDVLESLAKLSGFDIKNQVSKSVDVRLPHRAFGKRPLDEVLKEIAEGANPRLEILDLDPDAKTARVVTAAATGRPLVVPQPGHRSGIVAIERSPDGKRIITEGREGTINLWGMDTRTTLRSYIGKVAENAFSLDGQLAIVSRNNTIARYNFARNRPEVVFGTGANIASLSFSPTKNWIWAGSADGVVYVVDQRDPAQRKFFTDPPGIKHVSTTRDGSRTAVYVADSTTLSIWDTSAPQVRDVAGTVVATIQTRGPIKAARFSPDGKRLAIWHDPGAVSLFDQDGRALRVSNGQYPGELVSFDDPENPQPTPFSFSTSGATIAVANGNDRLTLFASADGRTTGQISRPVDARGGSWILSAACWLSEGPDAQVVVGLDTNELARDEDKLAIYSLASGQRGEVLKGQTRAVSGIAFSRDGRVLVAQEDGGFRRWDVTMRIPPAFTPAQAVGVQTTNWMSRNESDNGLFIVGVSNERATLEQRTWRPSSTSDRKVPHAKRWFFGQEEAAQTYPLQWINPAGVNSVVFSGDGQRVAWLAQNHVFLGEVTELSPRRFNVPEGPIISARLSSTGRFLVTVSGQARSVVRIWDLAPFWSGGEPKEFWKPDRDGERNLVDERSAAVDKQRNRIAVSIGTNTYAFSLSGQDAGALVPGRHPSWSDDGRYLAVADRGACKVYAVDVDGNRLQLALVHTSPSDRYSPVLSPSGGQVVTFSQDRLEAYYQNWSINRSEAKWDRHRAPIRDVAFSSFGGIVATSSDDGTIWLYGKKKEPIKLKNNGPVAGDDDRGGHPLVQLRALDEDNFVVTDIYNQYWASKEAASLINFTAGGQSFSYSQFDLILNRPYEIMRTVEYATSGKFGLEADINIVESAVKMRLKYGKEGPLPPIDDTFRFEAPTTPSVEVVGDPKTGDVTLDVGISDHYAPLVKWNVSVNNVPETLANEGAVRTDPRSGEVRMKHRLRLLPGENTVRVWTVNERQVSSLAHELRLTVPPIVVKPNLVVIAVGVSNYVEGIPTLPAAVPDATRFTETFRRFDRTQKDSYSNSPYAKVVRVTLKDAKKADILTAARRELKGLNPQDHVVILLAGHGKLSDESVFHFLPVDYLPSKGFSSAISYDELQGVLKGCGSRNMLVLIDACQAGAVPGYRVPIQGATDERKEDQTLSFQRTYKLPSANSLSAIGMNYAFAYLRSAFIDLENESGATVISAVTGSGTAYEAKNGLIGGYFGTAVLEAFDKSSGADQNKDGKVSVQELKAYVIERVPRLDPNRTLHLRQRPSVRQENLESDFAVYTYGVAAPAAKKPAPKKPATRRRGGG